MLSIEQYGQIEFAAVVVIVAIVMSLIAYAVSGKKEKPQH